MGGVGVMAKRQCHPINGFSCAGSSPATTPMILPPPVTVEIKDGIAIFKYREGLFMSLEIAKETVSIRKEALKGESFIGILYVDNLKGVSKRAREYLGSPESYEGTIAAALICNSIISAMLANFFLRVNGSPVPSRVFSSEEKAVLWIKKWAKK